ncbi:MAG: HAMP domain-containing sensor histidine kinase [Bacteroidota bacterium]
MPKILVVEDEPSQRLMIQTILRLRGFTVFSAEHGLAGIELARTELPDLIISDIHMEEMDGYSLVAAVRNDPATSTIPIILITSLADREGMRHGMELGADDYLQKPFATEELLKAINSRLQKHRTLMEQANKRLDDLRTSMSISMPHELRTPLNGILGYADILRKQHEDLEKSEIERMAERIYKNGKRLERLVENYLIYSQTELNKFDIKSTQAAVDARPQPVDELIPPVATQKALDFGRTADLKLDVASTTINMASKYFTKILDELLDNAFKFSKAGSSVRVNALRNDDDFFLSVSDEGRGMTPQQVSQIDAFVQFDRSYYEQQGQGLGLTVARRLVQLHGGNLTIDSEYGRGTTVTVIFPAQHALQN